MRGTAAYVLAFCLILCACQARKERDNGTAKANGAPSADSIGLDSCARLDLDATPQNVAAEVREPLPVPRSGSWRATKRVVFAQFSIDIPNVSAARPLDAAIEIDSFPSCRFFCDLTIQVFRDTTTLDAYVARMRVVDTTNNPDGADWAPGLPHELRMNGLRAVYMARPCGDCTSGFIVLSRSGSIAEMEYSLDDREGTQPGIECRIMRVASTFRWREG